jgi:hypothetical protein
MGAGLFPLSDAHAQSAFRKSLSSLEIPVGCQVRAFRKQQIEFDRRCSESDRLVSTLRTSYLSQPASTVSDVQQALETITASENYLYGAVMAASLVRDASLLPALEKLQIRENKEKFANRFASRVIEKIQTGRCAGVLKSNEVEICKFEDPMIEQARLLGRVK